VFALLALLHTTAHHFPSCVVNPLPLRLLCCAAGEGWVSGYIVAPPQCGSAISARACQRCITSKASGPCLACAKSPQLKSQLLDSLYGGIYTLVPADGCAACFNSAAPGKCTACLFGKKPCAECALQPENIEQPSAKMDVTACVDCR
jgi:hypothetical protein